MASVMRYFVAVVTLGCLTGNLVCACAQKPSEHQIKAAFLSKFASFVQWPPEVFPSQESFVTIGILGEDPFGSTLDRIVAGKVVNGRKFEVRRFRGIRDIQDCHILFVSSSERHWMGEVLSALERRSILTVGDLDQFAQDGGVINFVMEGNKVRFEVNVGAADRAGLKISSKLLSLATTVGRWPEEEHD